ncbi:inverse autotransporter beta domain-containing protein [Xenorhabdus japonica]|uniref:Adhesin/invasin n=1 Tax=Xenorhabdus japonica TaxID=53341 RepID=A0A1I5BN60_9GAMM|nr:inverse autotransporter beta domain-containing protein [Xenorhabdus japonica]SFN76092.1 adhesin/invasin [Xenorhabdus japonica]
MDSYISKKFVRFLVFIYSILIFPLTSLSAFAVDGKKYEHQLQKKLLENQESENNLNDKENETAGLIARNIRTVSNVLSSSPSELTEQAKAYALGKINSAVNSEAQKWLSQFGTAKINFSMDRKGKLDNGSLDLLLPLYDNKSDWLFFSQLGYRNKDSRHTLNLGFGGRYFTPSWMYGLNSFYDFDVTGNNKRIGLGGEAWTDYAKFSANTYLRVSDWHDSPHEKGWEERPANGFDINGEFFLPVYPNIGGKLAYEQYFGDQVALFNRDTKQKDPSLARFGVNYTPVPLVTMGVDYKLGSGGHSETLFQTNLNYRFGVPFEAQLSSDSVASMRTLAGSRYDLVERNNQIVLDYRKKGEKEVLLNIQQQNITGYSYQRWAPIHATVTPKDAKLEWQLNDSFAHAQGEVTEGVNPIGLTLPKYDPDSKTDNTYVLSFTAKDSNGKESKPSNITVKVEPFVLKEDVTKEVVKTGKTDEVAYKLLATITHGTKDKDPLAKLKVSNLQWSVDEPNTDKVKWVQSDTTNDKGQLEATVSSTQLLKDVKVYLTMDGMPKKEVNNLNFAKVAESKYKVKVETKESGPLVVGKNEGYIFTATVTDAAGNLLKGKDVKVDWSVKGGLPDGVTWLNEKKTDKTDENGQISATLVSNKAAKDIIVEVTIDGAEKASAKPVEFTEDDSATSGITWTGAQEYEAVKGKQHVVAVNIQDITKFKPEYTYNITFDKDKYPGLKSAKLSSPTTLRKQMTFTFESTQETEPGVIELTLTEAQSGKTVKISSPPISFKAGLNAIKVGSFEMVNINTNNYKADGQDKVNLKINVNYSAGGPARNLSIDPSKIEWSTDVVDKLKDKFTFTVESPTTNDRGELYANMVSNVSIWKRGNGVKPKVKLPTSDANGGQEVDLKDDRSILFNPIPKRAQLHVFNKDKTEVNYTYKADKHGPSNVFNSLQAYLLYEEDGKRLPANGTEFDVTYEADEHDSIGNRFIDKNSGLISFNITPKDRFEYVVLEERTFRATLTDKSTFERTAYEYHWKPERWFLLMGVEAQALNQTKNQYCPTREGLEDVKETDVWNYNEMGDGETLLNEFEEIVDWGFFTVSVKGSYQPKPSGTTFINVLKMDKDKFKPIDLTNINEIGNPDIPQPVACLLGIKR